MFDSIQNTAGADDNGTGVAALLELTHLFADVSIETDTPVSLELIFFDLEEAGWDSTIERSISINNP